MKECKLCGVSISEKSFECHSRECMKKQFSRVTEKGKKIPSTFCQVCKLDISGMSEESQNEHVNGCFDSNITKNHKCTEDTQVHQSKDACSICKKILVDLTPIERLQHVNSCADQISDGKILERKKKEALELAHTVVLDCPVCGQQFKTKKGKQSHLKRCAAKHQVSSEVLKASIVQQENEYKQKLEAGYIPEEVLNAKPGNKEKNKKKYVKKKTKVNDGGDFTGPDEARNTDTTGRNCALHDVDRKFEEDVQVAMALSVSISDQHSTSHTPEAPKLALSKTVRNSNCNLNTTKVDKDAFSLLMTQKKADARKKVKGKRKVKVCLEKLPLLVQSQQEINNKLVDRVSGVILSQTKEDTSATPQFNFSRVGEKYKPQENDKLGMASFWNKTVMHCSLLPSTDEVFYVSKLMPPITKCTVPAGSKVKNLACIPGWNSFKEPEKVHEKKPSRVSLASHNDTIDGPVCTQTADLLAELAQEHGTTTLIQAPDATILNRTQYTEEPSGFLHIDKDPLEHLPPVLKDFASMIHNPLCSDLTLCVAGHTIPVHKFVMAARCPSLLKLAKHDQFNVGNFSKESVDVMLRYLYTGCLDIPKDVALDVKSLAYAFNLEELRVESHRVVDEYSLEPVPEETQSSNLNPDVTLQRMLKDAWGSSSDESTSSSDTNDSAKNVDLKEEETTENQKENEDKELESLYTFIASQRRCKQTNDNDESMETNSSGRDSVEMEQVEGGFVNSPANKLLNGTISQNSVDRLKHLSDKEVLERIHSGSDVMFIHELSQVLLTEEGDTDSDGGSSLSVLPSSSSSSSESDMDVEMFGNSEDKQDASGDGIFSRNQPELHSAENKIKMAKVPNNMFQLEISSGESDMDTSRNQEAEWKEETSGQLNDNKMSRSKCNERSVGSQNKSKQMPESNMCFGKNRTPKECENHVYISSNVAEKSVFHELYDTDSNCMILSDNEDLPKNSEKVVPLTSVTIKSTVVNVDQDIDRNPITPEHSEVNESDTDCSSIISYKNIVPKPQISFSAENEQRGIDSKHKLSEREDSKSPMLFLNSQPQQSNESLNNCSSLEGSCAELFDSFAEKSSYLQDTGKSEVCHGTRHDEDLVYSGNEDNLNTAINISVSSTPSPVFHLQDESTNKSIGDNNSSAGACGTLSRKSMDSDFGACQMIMDEDSSESSRKRKRQEYKDDKHVRHSKQQKTEEKEEENTEFKNTTSVNRPGYDFSLGSEGGVEVPCSPSSSKDQNKNIQDINAEKFKSNSEVIEGISHGNALTPHKESMGRLEEKELIDLTAGSGDELKDPANLSYNVWEDFEDDGVLLGCMDEDDQPLTNNSQSSQKNDHTDRLQQSSSDAPSSPEIPSSHHFKSSQNMSVGNNSKRNGKTSDAQLLANRMELLSANTDKRESTDDEIELIDPPTDVSTNVSGLLDISDDCGLEKVIRKQGEKSTFTTPVPVAVNKGQIKKSLSEWVPPSPYTPQPEYEAMATPQLQKMRKDYGLRDMPKKKMITVLKHIYKGTHDYETDPELDEEAVQKARVEQIQDQLENTAESQGNAKETKGKQRKKKALVNSAKQSNKGKNTSKKVGETSSQINKRTAHAISSTDDSETDQSTSSQFLAEESILEGDESEPKLSKRDVQYKRKQLWDLIMSNTNLQLQFLHYEPIDIEEFQKLMKDAKLSIGTNIVKDFLDEKSIPFSLRSQNKASYGRKGKKKKNNTKE